MKILYRIMYINMLSVLLDKFLDKSVRWTFLEQSDSETQTGWTISEILIWIEQAAILSDWSDSVQNQVYIITYKVYITHVIAKTLRRILAYIFFLDNVLFFEKKFLLSYISINVKVCSCLQIFSHHMSV